MSSAEVRLKLVGDVVVIYPGAYLNQLKGEVIEQRCQELISEGVRRLVISFQETELINSIGISLLVGVIDAMNQAAGTLMLSDLSPTNRELFEVLGLLSCVDVAETEKAALARLTGAGNAIG